MSRVFFDELGLPRPEHRLDLGGGSNTDADRAHARRGRRPARAPRRRTRCSSTGTPTRRSRARWPPRRRASRSRTSRRACAPSTARCPRSSTASSPTTRPTCCCARARRRPSTCAPSGSAGRIEVVGDVMVDIAQLRRQVEPRAGDYVARHRPPRRQRRRPGAPARARRAAAGGAGPTSSSRCTRAPAPGSRPHGLLDRLAAGVELLPPLGYLEFTALDPRRQRRAHRLRRRAEGGLPRRRPLRHPARRPRSGRRRSTPAGTRSSTSTPHGRAGGARGAAARRAPAALRRRPRGRARRRRSRRIARVSERPIRVAVAGLGYWGPNLARNFGALPGCELAWLCDATPTALARVGAQHPNARRATRPRRGARRRHGRRRRPRHAGPDARRRSPSACSTPASTASSRSRWPRPSPTPSASSPPRRARKRLLMVGHLLEYHPARRDAQGDRGLRAARRPPLRLLAPPQPRQAARRRERAVVARRARRLRDAAPARRRGAGGGRRARRELHAPARSRTSSSASCASRPAAPRTCTCPGWTRTRSARSPSSAPSGWRPSTTWTSSARSPSTTRASTSPPRATASTSPGRATSGRPRIPSREPLRIECEHFVECVRTGTTPRSDGESGLRVVRVLEQAQAQLDASRREHARV